MDPNEALAQARHASAVMDADPSDFQVAEAAQSLHRAFDALDQWLSRRGFLPADWDRP